MRPLYALSLALFMLAACSTPNNSTKKGKEIMESKTTRSDTATRIALPQVDHSLGVSLMQALKDRRTERKFSPTPLPLSTLSGLLWAANGINRSNGKRTSPTLWPIEIYVALPQGLYLWDATTNTLHLKRAEDIRALTGVQEFTQSAPVTLIYVLDYDKMDNPWIPQLGGKPFFAGNAAGYVSQNVYLYAAAQRLATVALASIDHKALTAKLDLKPNKHILLTQPVGFPPP